MEIHQLRYVVAVARTRNFSRAAEQCHVSQPSLSQQVQKLEEELGEKLFDRLKRETKLTAAGELFLTRAARILDEVEAAKREAMDSGALLRGVVHIGVLPTIAPYLLPPVVAEFSRRFPGVEIAIHEETTARLMRLLQGCEIDLALASHPIHDERLQIRELFAEELLLALPRKHQLARKRSIEAADIEGETLIVMQEGHCLGDQVLRFCERSQVRPSISFRSAQLETIQALVKSGLGIALIPAMARRTGREAPEYRSLESRPERQVVAAWLRQRAPGRAAAEMLRVVERVAVKQ